MVVILGGFNRARTTKVQRALLMHAISAVCNLTAVNMRFKLLYSYDSGTVPRKIVSHNTSTVGQPSCSQRSSSTHSGVRQALALNGSTPSTVTAILVTAPPA
eukprot:3617-Heterococcus_DN1.PRE.2